MNSFKVMGPSWKWRTDEVMVSKISLAILLNCVTHNPFISTPLKCKYPLSPIPLGYPTASWGSVKKHIWVRAKL